MYVHSAKYATLPYLVVAKWKKTEDLQNADRPHTGTGRWIPSDGLSRLTALDGKKYGVLSRYPYISTKYVHTRGLN